MAKIILTAVIEVTENEQQNYEFYRKSPESLLQDCESIEVKLEP